MFSYRHVFRNIYDNGNNILWSFYLQPGSYGACPHGIPNTEILVETLSVSLPPTEESNNSLVVAMFRTINADGAE